MNAPKETWIGIVGCGYVADYYMATLKRYPWLRVTGAFDRDAKRLDVFCRHYAQRAFASLEDLLDIAAEMAWRR